MHHVRNCNAVRTTQRNRWNTNLIVSSQYIFQCFAYLGNRPSNLHNSRFRYFSFRKLGTTKISVAISERERTHPVAEKFKRVKAMRNFSTSDADDSWMESYIQSLTKKSKRVDQSSWNCRDDKKWLSADVQWRKPLEALNKGIVSYRKQDEKRK